MLTTLATLAGIWLGVVYIYIAATHAKTVYEREGLSLFWSVHIVPLVVLGIVLDVAFNVVFGSVMFRERPHEWLFTKRCRRHMASPGWRGRLAAFWKKQLNQFDPGHI